MLPSGTNKSKQNCLMLDNIVASQPELGPAPPDGGYGWIILLAAIVIKIILSSILVTSGLFICYILGASSTSLEGIHWILLPVVYFAMWNFTDPWSVTLSSVVSGRCMAALGVILCAAGLIVASFTPSNLQLLYALSGLFGGIGASLSINESDYMLQKYFRVHIRKVFTLCHIGQAAGEIMMPFLVSFLLTNNGIQGTLIILAAFVLQALLAATLFRQPKYQQNSRNLIQYSLLQGENKEEDEECYDNLACETRHETNFSENNKPLYDTQVSQNGHAEGQASYEDFPKPLFIDSDIGARNQDIVFSVDEPDDEELVIFMQGPPLPSRSYTCSKELYAVLHPMFCFALALNASTQISTIALWVMFPPYVMSQRHNAGVAEIALLLSLVGCASICPTVVSHYIPDQSLKCRKLFLVTSSLLIGTGWYLLTFGSALLVAAMLIRLGVAGVTHSLHVVMMDTLGTSQAARMHTPLHIFTGLLIGLTSLGFDTKNTGKKIHIWKNKDRSMNFEVLSGDILLQKFAYTRPETDNTTPDNANTGSRHKADDGSK